MLRRLPVLTTFSCALLFLLAPAVAAPSGDGLAVPLLPEGESQIDLWQYPITLGSPSMPPVMVTLRFPAEPVLLLENVATDDIGMVWHLEVAEPKMWGDIRFVMTPSGTEIDPFTLFLASTLFPEDAIALAQTDDLLEVEAPVDLNGARYRGCFRAERVGNVVAVGAFALPEPVEANVRATAWASLRSMLTEQLPADSPLLSDAAAADAAEPTTPPETPKID